MQTFNNRTSHCRSFQHFPLMIVIGMRFRKLDIDNNFSDSPGIAGHFLGDIAGNAVDNDVVGTRGNAHEGTHARRQCGGHKVRW